ncbi:MAG: HlyD family efflux transporter periplasmic adaptor subunit [Gemmatimonadaceae bacterium]
MRPTHRGLRRLATSASLLAGLSCTHGPEAVQAVGTVEMTETDVAATVPARIVRVFRNEGDTVRRGDTLVTLSQATLGADLDQRRARVVAAEADLRDLEAGARPAERERAQAELRTADAEADRTRRDAERLRALAAAGHISQAQLDNAEAAAKVASGRRDAAAEAMRLVDEGARPERIRAARAGLATARAQLAMAEATAADLVLTAPVDGIVLGRYAEAGEVLPAAVPALSLGEPKSLWVRVYVAAPQLATLHVGQGALIRVSGADSQPVRGRIVAIATRAEFTPRVALTEKERADLLFGVKVELTDTASVAKPGLPVTVSFNLAERSGTGE